MAIVYLNNIYSSAVKYISKTKKTNRIFYSKEVNIVKGNKAYDPILDR